MLLRLIEKAKRGPVFPSLDLHMQEVLKRASFAFLMKITGAGLSFTLNVILARMLGAKGAGIFSLAYTVMMVASVISRVGLDSSLLRHTAANTALQRWDKVRGLYSKGMTIATCSSLLSTLLILLGANLLAVSLFSVPDLVAPLRLMAVGILPLSLILLHIELLKGLKKIQYAMLLDGFGAPLLSIVLCLLLAAPYGVVGAVLAYVVSLLVIALLGIVLWHKATPQLSQCQGSFSIRALLVGSLPLYWAALMWLLMCWTDTLMLGVWMDSAAVAIYGAALKTSALLGFFMLAVNSIAVPKFAELYAQHERENLRQLVQNTSTLLTLITLPAFLVFILIPERVLSVFGEEFIHAKGALVILSIGQCIHSILEPTVQLLIMGGYQKSVRNTISLAAILNVALNAILVPHMGLIGAAIATAASMTLKNLVASVIVFRKLSILVFPLPGWMLKRRQTS